MNDLVLLAGEVVADGLFAVVACIGFALISNASRPVCLLAGLLAGLGHAGRFVLLDLGMGITSASLCAATLVSFCSMACARRWHTPAEFYAFPALLPMIPGMYAYKSMFSIVMFFQKIDDTAVCAAYLDTALRNGMITVFVILTLAAGATLPILMFPSKAYTMTRRQQCQNNA